MRPKQADKRKLRLVLLSIISAIVVAMAAYYIIFIMPFSAPSAPRDFMSSSTDDKVMLSWAAPLSSGSSPVTNYRIYRSNSSENETFLAQVGNCLLVLRSQPVRRNLLLSNLRIEQCGRESQIKRGFCNSLAAESRLEHIGSRTHWLEIQWLNITM